MNSLFTSITKKIIDIVINFIILIPYLYLGIFYTLYVLLYIDYGKKPDDDILITKSYYYHFFDVLEQIGNKIGVYAITVGIFFIVLRIFGIKLISKKQIIIFICGYILLFVFPIIDPFGVFNWYFS